MAEHCRGGHSLEHLDQQIAPPSSELVALVLISTTPPPSATTGLESDKLCVVKIFFVVVEAIERRGNGSTAADTGPP